MKVDLEFHIKFLAKGDKDKNIFELLNSFGQKNALHTLIGTREIAVVYGLLVKSSVAV